MSVIAIVLIAAAAAVAVLYLVDRKFILNEVTKLRNDAAFDINWIHSHLPGAPGPVPTGKVLVEVAPNAVAATATQPPPPVILVTPAVPVPTGGTVA